ncbi:SpvB/TcaC N-terminal domain-containing protein [Pseudomonas sp. HR96]|uniref:SpvB/TcaC N-terminal domain-containing protein n=1 Tax=Pseudomonas sp. HR96 TaxID=1027966 RepID=UPI002A747776|nr:SpvB/TcaC N-terminal domain-containing protein [Pseudomonas sp. HR96]WPO99503.1 SpvB/TcaC N-terminal domain-containing protein [Pseudomonas sp. HR96]
MNNPQNLSISAPTLPKGGGAITGMGESSGGQGPSGQVQMTLPLPISSGRTLTPALALSYSSAGGNGPFGLGWSCAAPMISRRTRLGVPQYGMPGSDQLQDEFLDPDGELLVPERDAQGTVVSVQTEHFGPQRLGARYRVTRYFPRTEARFDRLEHWFAEPGKDFWLLHGREGTLQMFGKTTAARISDPAQPAHTAAWLLEEMLAPNGDDMWFQYRQEAHVESPGARANRYLSQVSYGNRTPAERLFLWQGDAPAAAQRWLFTLVFDYGERGLAADTCPSYAPSGPWLPRADSFSRYDYGFEVRTQRLCHQVLMYHCAVDSAADEPSLVTRLLLEYRADPAMSLLTAAQSLAYEVDGSLCSLPPLELGYTASQLPDDPARWQALEDFPNLDGTRPFHLVDLYGEGLPGVLYRDAANWQYRPPVRARQQTEQVAYGPAEALPQVPSLQGQQLQLLDLTGNGQLDWMLAQPGLAGFFSLSAKGAWGDFQPLGALPSEGFHPQAQLARLVGSGLADLALIGPRSVRLYANQGGVFAPALSLATDSEVTLPVAGQDAGVLIAFADMLGSGQAHLVQISHARVRCWPNLGRGRFAAPVDLRLDQAIDRQGVFNPDQLFLADLDGSGTSDLIYARHDSISLYRNLAGNGFAAPVRLALPPGLRYDSQCRITLADIAGTGCVELILTVPGGARRHWRYRFFDTTPRLLSRVVNNRGAQTTFSYRNSTQFWLDEKAEHPGAVPGLPLAMPLLHHSTLTDEVTGNVLSSQHSYRQGVYDGQQREFRGFAYVQTLDSGEGAQATGADLTPAPALLTRHWYHCGREHDERQLYGVPFAGDALAPRLNATRLVRYDPGRSDDQPLANLDPQSQWWLYRALRGRLLRSETWAADPQASAPYSCRYQRHQVRLVQAGAQPVALPVTLESVELVYEQLVQDPAVSHRVLLQMDAYGVPLWTVDLAYPRRAAFTPSPYPDYLPADAWAGSYDAQQQTLSIDERRASAYHLDRLDYTNTATAPYWALGLPALQRSNRLSAVGLPAAGVSHETLKAEDGLLAPARPRHLQGQSENLYSSTPPTLPVQVRAVRTALLDGRALEAYQGVADMPSLQAARLGYAPWQTQLNVDGASAEPLWAADVGLSEYAGPAHFYRKTAEQSSALAGRTTLSYDACSLLPISHTDALGNIVKTVPDYRFGTARALTDINGNVHEVRFDALGQVIQSSHHGSEEDGVAVGFRSLDSLGPAPAASIAAAIAQALDPVHVQQTATVTLTDPFSWMGQVEPADLSADPASARRLWQALLEARCITASGHVRLAGREWAAQVPGAGELPHAVVALLASRGGVPVHSLSLVADRYPQAGTVQQIRISLSYSDGFGRLLQQCTRVAPGEAWQRRADGELDTRAAPADPRWVVSARVEYDSKGQVVRRYQPFFIDDWRPVSDRALRGRGHSDRHHYDPLGRETHTVTALGDLRRTHYYPWFEAHEDENDTQGLGQGGMQ